jgi:Domain of unknown function (DUF4189)
MTTTHITSRRRLTTAALLVSAGAGVAALFGPPATADAAPVPEPDLYVSIAYSPSKQFWGLSSNVTRPLASGEALQRCGSKASDCQIVVVAKNGCAALAVDGTRFFGGTGPSYSAANADARAGLFGSGTIKASQCVIR